MIFSSVHPFVPLNLAEVHRRCSPSPPSRRTCDSTRWCWRGCLFWAVKRGPVEQGQSENKVGESIGKIVGEFIFWLKIPCNNFELWWILSVWASPTADIFVVVSSTWRIPKYAASNYQRGAVAASPVAIKATGVQIADHRMDGFFRPGCSLEVLMVNGADGPGKRWICFWLVVWSARSLANHSVKYAHHLKYWINIPTLWHHEFPVILGYWQPTRVYWEISQNWQQKKGLSQFPWQFLDWVDGACQLRHPQGWTVEPSMSKSWIWVYPLDYQHFHGNAMKIRGYTPFSDTPMVNFSESSDVQLQNWCNHLWHRRNHWLKWLSPGSVGCTVMAVAPACLCGALKGLQWWGLLTHRLRLWGVATYHIIDDLFTPC